MRILSVTAQRPDSTGSGVYLTELVRAFAANGHEQAVIAGVGAEDVPLLPEGVPCYAVHYGTEALPYPILGSDRHSENRSGMPSGNSDPM